MTLPLPIFTAALQADAKQAKEQLTDDDITAQALIFFLAGFEITATIMCLVSHELAIHPQIQERLQKEVDNVMETSKGQITYDDLMRMKYLDMVVLGILTHKISVRSCSSCLCKLACLRVHSSMFV